MPKSPNRSCQFWGRNSKTLHHRFWGQTAENRLSDFKDKPRINCRHRFWGQTVTTGFEIKPEKTVSVVLMPNHWQTIDLGFEAQPRKLRSSSPHTWCRPHTVSPDLSIVWPPSTRPVRPSPVHCTRSPNPTTIIVAACHVTRATYTPRDKQSQFSKRYKDKGKTTEISCIRIQTSPSQLHITIKPRNIPLYFLISPLMSPLTIKDTKFEVRIQNPMKHN
jgi:hypothetical protein